MQLYVILNYQLEKVIECDDFLVFALLMFYPFFSLSFLSLLCFFSDGGCDSFCVPGAIPALLPAG